jgi:chemotaxis protein MotB
MELEEKPPEGAPGWIVTYGDIMSLMLTFFILLASMSEVKKEGQCKAAVESLQKRFGRDSSAPGLIPGSAASQDSSALAMRAAMGRTRRLDTIRGGTDIAGALDDCDRLPQSPASRDCPQVGEVSFDEGSNQLTDESQQQLQVIARRVQGQSQKVEIRGWASGIQEDLESPYRDPWDLAYVRCHNAGEALVKLGVNRNRITIRIAAHDKPAETSVDTEGLRDGPRVEVFVLTDLVKTIESTPKSKQESRFADAR